MTETATAHTGVPAAGSPPSGGSSGQEGGVRAAAHDIGEQARNIAETGKQEATKVMGEVRSQASNVAGEAGQRARGRAEEQVDNAARMLGEMSDELDRMAASSQGSSALTALARDGATTMRSVAQRLDTGGLDAAMHDVRVFARRRPVVFLSGAFAVGMLVGRLIRNADLDAVKRQLQEQPGQESGQSAMGGTVDTGTTARIEGGMEPALDAAGADLPAGMDAEWDEPALQGSGAQASQDGRQP